MDACVVESYKQLCETQLIDVCRYLRRVCDHGRCVSEGRSYRCLCDAGYRLTDPTTCAGNPTVLIISIIIIVCFQYIVKTDKRFLPSVSWRCWLGGRKGIRPVTNSSAAAERPREPLSQLKSCQLLHNCTKNHI